VAEYQHSDLATFLAHLDWTCGLIETADDLFEIAYQQCQRAAAAGVLYADVIVNPTHWPSWRTRLDAFVDALDAGFAAAEVDGFTRAGLCPSIKRTQSRSQAVELVEWLLEANHPRVVGLSIDGNEFADPLSGARFADAFRLAADKGIRRAVHAGESSGPDGVRDALAYLAPERIDHGVRSVEDPALIAELADRRIALDICPTSNVLLGVVGSYAEHPVETLRRAGVPFSLNTDDPLLFDTDVCREYCTCAATFGWDGAVLASVARTSIESAFCDVDLRDTLLARLDGYLAVHAYPG
jgi:adenosine deaminase